MKKLKCIKCGLRYRDRNSYGATPSVLQKELCTKCAVIWRSIGYWMTLFDTRAINRIVSIRLEDVIIKKRGKGI